MLYYNQPLKAKRDNHFAKGFHDYLLTPEE